MRLDVYLNYAGNCRQAFHFYEQHLGGKIKMMMTHGQGPNAANVPADEKNTILHAQIEIGNAVLMGADIATAEAMRSAYLALTLRVTYPFSANMSLQMYAQPFIAKGTFSAVRELSANPRAADYAGRYLAYGDTAFTNNIGGFNFKQFRSNVVFRWEYRPGSTLFLVWSQGRQGSTGAEGSRSFGGDLDDLFNLRADNSFLVKVSYWINR